MLYRIVRIHILLMIDADSFAGGDDGFGSHDYNDETGFSNDMYALNNKSNSIQSIKEFQESDDEASDPDLRQDSTEFDDSSSYVLEDGMTIAGVDFVETLQAEENTRHIYSMFENDPELLKDIMATISSANLIINNRQYQRIRHSQEQFDVRIRDVFRYRLQGKSPAILRLHDKLRTIIDRLAQTNQLSSPTAKYNEIFITKDINAILRAYLEEYHHLSISNAPNSPPIHEAEGSNGLGGDKPSHGSGITSRILGSTIPLNIMKPEARDRLVRIRLHDPIRQSMSISKPPMEISPSKSVVLDVTDLYDVSLSIKDKDSNLINRMAPLSPMVMTDNIYHPLGHDDSSINPSDAPQGSLQTQMMDRSESVDQLPYDLSQDINAENQDRVDEPQLDDRPASPQLLESRRESQSAGHGSDQVQTESQADGRWFENLREASHEDEDDERVETGSMKSDRKLININEIEELFEIMVQQNPMSSTGISIIDFTFWLQSLIEKLFLKDNSSIREDVSHISLPNDEVLYDHYPSYDEAVTKSLLTGWNSFQMSKNMTSFRQSASLTRNLSTQKQQLSGRFTIDSSSYQDPSSDQMDNDYIVFDMAEIRKR